MKTAVLFILFLAIAFGFNTLDSKNGHDVLRELEAGNHNVYVIMFHAGATEGSALDERNNDYENTLNDRVLDKYENFWFTKVDANNRDYSELIKQCDIIVDDLRKSPSILIMENGNGAWIHGPQTIAKLEEYAPAYNKRSQKA